MGTVYKRVSRGLSGNYTLIPYTDAYEVQLQKFIEEDKNADYYETIYDYSEEHKAIYDEKDSVAGLRDLTTSRLVFDFDDAKNPANAKEDAVQLVTRLIEKGVPDKLIQVYFSGNKGFHVQVDTERTFNKKEVDSIIKNLVEGLPTADTKILDENRLFRVPLTKHAKTGLLKIPVSLNMLSEKSIEYISKQAKYDSLTYKTHKKTVELFRKKKLSDVPEGLLQLIKIKPEKDNLDNYLDQGIKNNDIDFSLKPAHLSSAKYALQQGYFGEGERNQACMILASTYKYLGYDQHMTYYMLKAACDARKRRSGIDYDKDRLWPEVIDTVYGANWKKGTYSEEDTPLLQKIVKEFSLDKKTEKSSFKMAKDITQKAIDFICNLEQNRVYTGIPTLDENVVMTKGMMCGILGAPSSGKTSLVNQLVEYTSMSGNNCYYLSLDMSDDLLTLKMISKYMGISIKKLHARLKDNPDDDEIMEAVQQFHQNFKNVAFNFNTGFEIEEIRNSIAEYKKYCGGDLSVVAIDYLEKIRGPHADATANSALIAGKLADMAKDLDVCILLLLQPQKHAGAPDSPLRSMRNVKGSSVIEQDCRVILTLWRPGFDPQYAMDREKNVDKYTTIAVVKQNMGSIGEFNFKWNGARGEISEMTANEENEFQEDMAIIQQRNAAKEAKRDF